MKRPEQQCLLDGCRGIYLPQAFYDCFDFNACNLDRSNFAELSDPDNESYWDAWDEVLSDAVWYEPIEPDSPWVVEWRLYQDGDLFAVPVSATNQLTDEFVDFTDEGEE